MSRRVLITGLGPLTGFGAGIDPLWEGLCAGRSAVAGIEGFDPGGFGCRIASEVRDFKIRDYVPKTYRKATKVMARDIELAVAAADLAARDAGLQTAATAEGEARSYDATRFGAHIGAGLIATDLDELTAALAEADAGDGSVDLKAWGREGMNALTPLWLLKYLPNMLACHVTIVHDAQGPSNTITCNEASSGLSLGESVRVIQRDAADLCFCGGAESKINPMAFLRQVFTGRLNTTHNPPDGDPAAAVRPFDRAAAGTALGEGGGIVILEAADTFANRSGDKHAYAEVLGTGASQTVSRDTRNRAPDPEGRGIASAIRSAIADASLTPDDIDLAVPYAAGIPGWDRAELAALTAVFGDRLAGLPITPTKPAVGNTGAAAGGVDLAVAAKALDTQTIPPVINRDAPLDPLPAGSPEPREATLRHALVCSTSLGGQNVAVVLGRVG